MKTRLRLYSKYRSIISFVNLFRFTIRKWLIGFDYANLFLNRVDKYSTILILRKNGAKIGSRCKIENGLTFHNANNYSNLIIGDNVHIGKNVFFDLKNKVIIGNNVVISMNTTFLTHTDFGKSSLSELYKFETHPIIIENHCYIGANVTILMGIIIRESAIVAAHSLINKDISPFTLVGGVPGKTIKKLPY